MRRGVTPTSCPSSFRESYPSTSVVGTGHRHPCLHGYPYVSVDPTTRLRWGGESHRLATVPRLSRGPEVDDSGLRPLRSGCRDCKRPTERGGQFRCMVGGAAGLHRVFISQDSFLGSSFRESLHPLPPGLRGRETGGKVREIRGRVTGPVDRGGLRGYTPEDTGVGTPNHPTVCSFLNLRVKQV